MREMTSGGSHGGEHFVVVDSADEVSDCVEVDTCIAIAWLVGKKDGKRTSTYAVLRVCPLTPL